MKIGWFSETRNFLSGADTDRVVRVHGALRIVDELHAADACQIELRIHAHQVWRVDDAVFLPEEQIE